MRDALGQKIANLRDDRMDAFMSLKDKPKVYLVGQFGRTVELFEHEPLNKRGWTLQVRLLPPRNLHCGTQEIYQKCQHCVLAADGSMLN